MHKTRRVIDAQARVTFWVPQLWIGIDTIGATFEYIFGGERVTLSLPTDGDSFSALPEHFPHPPVPSLVQAGPVFQEEGRYPATAALVLFQVAIETKLEFPAQKPADLDEGQRQAVETCLREAIDRASEVAGRFVRHARAAAPAQSWLGLSSHPPKQYGVASLEYQDTGEFIFGLGEEQSVTVRSSRLRLDRADLDRISVNVASETEPPVAESLLADAWHLEDATAANDQDRAVLVAAVASEVKSKQAIRRSVGTDRLALAEMILKRRSNLPELLDEVLEACCDISLRRADPELYQRVKALSHQRNAIVHSGRRDEGGPAMATPAATASSIFEWIDKFVPPADHPDVG